jgi:putative PEP-CTERM system TPR-repeat lipoprotein
MLNMTSGFRAVAVSGLLVMLMLASAGCDFLVSPEQRYQRAQSLVEQGEYRRALVELKNALQKQADLHQARALLAKVALWLGDPQSAETELNRIPKSAGADAHAELRIRIDLALGRFAAVLEKLAAPAAGIAPAQVELFRAQALQALGKTAEAHQAFRAASKIDPSLLDAQVGIAETMALQGDLTNALALTGKLTEHQPNSALAWYSQGSLLARSGKNEAAQKALLRAQELAGKQLAVPQQATLLATLIEIQLAARDVKAARANLEVMNRLVTDSPLATVMTARIEMAENDYAAAANGLRRLVNAAPQFAQGRYLLGVALVAQGNLEQASHELTQVVEQSPQNLEARQLLAQVRMRLKDPDGALRVLVPAIATNAGDSRLASLFDGARVQAGADRQTVEMLENAVENAPDSRGLQLQLATAYMQAGAADKAVGLLRRASSDTVDPRREAILLQAIAQSEGTVAARTQVQSLVASHGGEPEILGIAAGFYARVGEFDKGRTLLTEALAKKPKQPALLLALARVEWSAGRPDAARSTLQELISVEPSNEAAQLALVELDLAQGNAAAAASRLEAMHKANPKAVETSLLLARLALARDDAKQADAFITAALQAAPNRTDVLNTAGLLYLQSGRFDQAAGMFQDGTASDAGNPQLWLNLGRAQLGLNQRGAARESLEHALSLQPDWLPASGALAFLEVQEGNDAAALGRIETLKQAHPKHAGVLALEGEIYAVLHRYAEASKAFEAAATLRPASELVIKTHQMRVAGGLPNPLEPLERWSREHPGDIALRTMLADAYMKANDLRSAMQQYEGILQRQPRHVQSLNNLAWLYHKAGDQRAVGTARQAHQLAPKSIAIMDTLGWILVETGQVAEGLQLLQQAASQPKAPSEIKYHYAAALARSGAREQAREQLTHLLGSEAAFDGRDNARRLLEELGGRE